MRKPSIAIPFVKMYCNNENIGLCHKLVETKNRTYPRRVGTGRRTAGRRGRAGTGNRTSTGLFAQKKKHSLPSRRFPDMLCMNGFTETKRRWSTGQQPRTKSASRPAFEPRINRLSTAGFVVRPPVYVGFPLFVLPRKCAGQLSSMP